MLIHFGVIIKEGKYGLKLDRENYAIINNKSSFDIKFNKDIYADEEGKTYKDEWCKQQLADCFENYDLNMEFFSQLNKNKFNNEISKFLRNNRKFMQVSDLNLYSGKSGYYIMILDDYCQLYIGTTGDIKKRIQHHWSARKSFDRLLFPMKAVDTSILSIDSFRALDTTRIYANISTVTYEYENDYINQFSPEFRCNRMSGGRIAGGLLQAIVMMKSRSLK